METVEETLKTEGDGVRRTSDYSRRIVATEDAPDFTAEWAQIRADLGDEAAGALRIGRNLIKIRDALKPLNLWIKALRENYMSPSQASRYIRFAELPERDREIFLRADGPFSLSDAVGERRRERRARASDFSPEKSPEIEAEVEIDADELADHRAEIDRRMKIAVDIVEAGVGALAGEPGPPEYAAADARWENKLREVADDVLAVIGDNLESELRERLFPC